MKHNLSCFNVFVTLRYGYQAVKLHPNVCQVLDIFHMRFKSNIAAQVDIEFVKKKIEQ